MDGEQNFGPGDVAPSRGMRRGGDAEAGYPEERFEPLRLLIIFRARWPLFLGIVAAAVVVAGLITAFTTPLYRATSTVVLERTSGPDAAPTPVDTTTVDTEVEVVRSRAIAQKVAAVIAAREGKPVAQVLPEIEAGVKAARSGLTSAINISFTAPSKTRARDVANVYAEQYLVAQKEAKATAGQVSGGFLTQRLASLKADVEKANQAISQYRASHGLQATPDSGYTQGEVSSYNQQVAAARAGLAEDEARLSLARSQLNRGAASGESFDSQLLRQLRARRAELSLRSAQLADRYGDQHPDLIKAKAEVADLDAQISAELKRVISGLESQSQVARQRMSSLQGSLGSARATLATGDAASLELAELERSAEAARTVYMDFLNRSKQADAASGGEQPDARILSTARTPGSPASPKVPLNMGLGLLFGLSAGAAAVLVAERMQSTLTTGRDVEEHLGMPFLVGLPLLSSVAEPRHKHLMAADYVLERPLSSFSESLRSLRTSLRTIRDGRPAKVIVFTSALPSEGKSTSAVCLARTAAQGGAKVLIVDCDLRRRNVNNLLGIDPPRGLLEVLTGQISMADAIMRDEPSGMDVLPLARSTFTPEELFDTPAMDDLLRRASAQYDLVVLDTAPALAVSDTRLIAAKADAVIFLAKWRQTPIQAVESAINLLNSSGAFVGGIVLSQVDMRRQARYGYGDQTYYYSKYRKYYQDT